MQYTIYFIWWVETTNYFFEFAKTSYFKNENSCWANVTLRDYRYKDRMLKISIIILVNLALDQKHDLAPPKGSYVSGKIPGYFREI